MEPLGNLMSQDIYSELISIKSYIPTSLRIWFDLFPILEMASSAEIINWQMN